METEMETALANVINEIQYECEYCHRTFHQKKSVKLHQRTVRSCIELQEQSGKEVHRKFYECTYESCSQTFTSITSLKYHVEKCKNKGTPIKTPKELQEELRLLREKLQHVESLVSNPAPSTNIGTQQIDNSNSHNTNSHNTTNNITIHQWMTEERIRQIFKEQLFALTDLEGSALAKFTMKNLVNGQDKPMYLCTDQSRQRMVFFDNSGNEVVDKDCSVLIDKVLQSKEYVKELINDDIVDKTPEEIAQLKPLYNGFKNLHENRSFKLELSKGLPNTPLTAMEEQANKRHHTAYDDDEPDWDINERRARERQLKEEAEKAAEEARKKANEPKHVPDPARIIKIPIIRYLPPDAAAP